MSDLVLINNTFTGRRLLMKITHYSDRIFISHGKIDGARYIPATADKSSYVTITYSGEDDTTPSFIKLAHELIHAYHYMRGKWLKECAKADASKWHNDEEYQTIVGFATKKHDRIYPKITENSIRVEAGLRPRTSYYKIDDSVKLADLPPDEVLHLLLGRHPALARATNGI